MNIKFVKYLLLLLLLLLLQQRKRAVSFKKAGRVMLFGQILVVIVVRIMPNIQNVLCGNMDKILVIT
jgi:uncharacterized membrane protein